jgi:hypothetical protein
LAWCDLIDVKSHQSHNQPTNQSARPSFIGFCLQRGGAGGGAKKPRQGNAFLGKNVIEEV